MLSLDPLLNNLKRRFEPKSRVPIIIELREQTRTILQEIQELNFMPKYESRYGPYVTGRAGLGQLDLIDKLRAVKGVWLDKRIKTMAQTSTDTIYTVNQASQFIKSNELYLEEIFGKGIRIAQIDTGVSDHPMLEGAIEEKLYTIGNTGEDDIGHGTHVASLMAGRQAESPRGTLMGVAPESTIVSIKAVDQRGGSDSTILEAIELAADKKPDIVNISLGSIIGMGGFDPTAKIIDKISKEQESTFVVAAGNQFLPGAISSPGDARQAITVGSCAINDPYPGAVSLFSSKGPSLDGRILPVVIAPGGNTRPDEAIYSAYRGGYAALKGTSMSTPIVSGGLALFMEKTGLRLNKEQYETLFSESLKKRIIPIKNNRKGWGVLNVSNMVNESERLSTTRGVITRPILRERIKGRMKRSISKRSFEPIRNLQRMKTDIKEIIGFN